MLTLTFHAWDADDRPTPFYVGGTGIIDGSSVDDMTAYYLGRAAAVATDATLTRDQRSTYMIEINNVLTDLITYVSQSMAKFMMTINPPRPSGPLPTDQAHFNRDAAPEEYYPTNPAAMATNAGPIPAVSTNVAMHGLPFPTMVTTGAYSSAETVERGRLPHAGYVNPPMVNGTATGPADPTAAPLTDGWTYDADNGGYAPTPDDGDGYPADAPEEYYPADLDARQTY